MNQVTLNRGAPRTSLLAAAVLSSLAEATASPTHNLKKSIIDAAPDKDLSPDISLTGTDSAKKDVTVTLRVDAKKAGTSVTAKKPYAKTTTGTKLFGKNGLVVAHHYEPHGCAGKMHRHEHLLVH